jgi:hypothetical protein
MLMGSASWYLSSGYHSQDIEQKRVTLVFMRIHLYTLCWNEADMLGFFFRHYDPWVDRYIIFDNNSTDRSLEILHRHPKVEVRRFRQTHDDSFVLSELHLHNNAWKESRGQVDWVVVTDIDEHLQAAGWDNLVYLTACARRGITLIPAIGYQMVSEDLPAESERLATTRTLGAPWSVMNKLRIFNPNAILETSYTPGQHRAQPVGELRLPPRDEMMLLHYKYLGFERTFLRLQRQNLGLGTTDLSEGHGDQYRWSLERFRAEWDTIRDRAVDVGKPGFRPWLSTDQGRPWWRPPTFRGFMSRRFQRLALAVRRRWKLFKP